MKIKFCGANKEVTGSAHLIELENGFRFYLDCGLYQGYDDDMDKFNAEWLVPPDSIDCVVLSHAHIDHIGRLPRLMKDGFNGNIYGTHATRSLAAILLLDSAMIQEKEAKYANEKWEKKGRAYHHRIMEPLYVPADVPPVLESMVTYGYNKWFNIHPDVQIKYIDAGHILGSASVNIKINEHGKETTIGFTGDIGRPNRPILRDPQPMIPADILLTESTYGDRLHQGEPDDVETLYGIIHRTCVEQNGKVIIPAFSVGRTQEIIYMMDQMANAGRLPRVKVYVDSPLAVNATAIYDTHTECYDKELMEYLIEDENPFGFNNLKYIKDVEESKALNTSDEPCVIISAAGMANAGRVQHHIINNCDNPRNTILIVGYCAPGTPGRMLRDGVQTIKLHGKVKPVYATIEVMDSFSAHGDRNEMTKFLQVHKQSARQIFLVHGDEEATDAFKTHLEADGFNKVTIPNLGDEVRII